MINTLTKARKTLTWRSLYYRGVCVIYGTVFHSPALPAWYFILTLTTQKILGRLISALSGSCLHVVYSGQGAGW